MKVESAKKVGKSFFVHQKLSTFAAIGPRPSPKHSFSRSLLPFYFTAFLSRRFHHVVHRPSHHALGHSGRHCPFGRLRLRALVGEISLQGHQSGHHVRVLCRHFGRCARTGARPSDALLCRKFRACPFCLHPRPASGSGLHECLQARRHRTKCALGGHRAARYAHDAGHGSRRMAPLCRPHRRAVRRHHQHACPRCRPTDAQAAGATLGRGSVELRRDLPHRHDWGHHRAGGDERVAQAPRALRRQRQ